MLRYSSRKHIKNSISVSFAKEPSVLEAEGPGGGEREEMLSNTCLFIVTTNQNKTVPSCAPVRRASRRRSFLFAPSSTRMRLPLEDACFRELRALFIIMPRMVSRTLNTVPFRGRDAETGQTQILHLHGAPPHAPDAQLLMCSICAAW